MLCPDCQYDNIEGEDTCASCGSPLIFEPPANDLDRCISRHTVAEMGSRIPVYVAPEDSLRDAIQMMTADKVGCVLVQEGEELVGILSEWDILHKVSPDLSVLDNPVSDYMSPSPQTITDQDSIAYALQTMDLGGFRHAPTTVQTDGTSGEKTTNIVSVRDILKYLRRHMSDA